MAILFISFFLLQATRAQQIVNIVRAEVQLMKRVTDLPQQQRDKILVDSLYRPYQLVWDGYLGDSAAFMDWGKGIAFDDLPGFSEKIKKLDLTELEGVFDQTSSEMAKLTGFTPEGRWAVLYGPGWCNICGGIDGSMVIDLANNANASVGDISSWLPHEMNHQIYSSRNPERVQTVIRRVVDEGLACYVSYLYYQKKRTVATELAYSEAAYQECLKHEPQIFSLIRDIHGSGDIQEIKKFGNRKYKFDVNYPGAIGYFIGFRMVEEYVEKFGEGSWKDIYSLPAVEVMQKSGILVR